MKKSYLNVCLAGLFFALPFMLITACSGEASTETPVAEEEEKKPVTPKDVVTEFVNAMAAGNCNKAKGMATGVAVDMVEGNLAAGCIGYSTSIKSVECTETGNTAECICVERRDGMDYTYDYDLEKVGEEWKVSEYGKDSDLEDTTTVDMDTTVVEEL